MSLRSGFSLPALDKTLIYRLDIVNYLINKLGNLLENVSFKTILMSCSNSGFS